MNRPQMNMNTSSERFDIRIWIYNDLITECRFGDRQKRAYMLIGLIPSEIENFQWIDIKLMSQSHQGLLDDVDAYQLRHELIYSVETFLSKSS